MPTVNLVCMIMAVTIGLTRDSPDPYGIIGIKSSLGIIPGLQLFFRGEVTNILKYSLTNFLIYNIYKFEKFSYIYCHRYGEDSFFCVKNVTSPKSNHLFFIARYPF